MHKLTIGQLFTHWRLLGLRTAHKVIYSDPSRKDYGCEEDGDRVMHSVIASRFPEDFHDLAHVIYRADKDGNPKALISADIHYKDDTVLIKNASLKDLAEYIR